MKYNEYSLQSQQSMQTVLLYFGLKLVYIEVYTYGIIAHRFVFINNLLQLHVYMLSQIEG